MIIRKTKKVPFKLDASQGVGAFSGEGSHSVNIVNGGPCLRTERKNEILFGNPPPLSDRHPWNVYLTWVQGDDKEITSGWYANIEPGFVNGLDPLIFPENVFPSKIKVASSAKSASRESPYAFGAAKVYEGSEEKDGVRAPGLMERPMVLMPTRAFTNIMAENKQTSRNAIAFFEKKYNWDRRAASSVGGGQVLNVSDVSVTIEGIQRSEVPVWVGSTDVYLSTARAASQTKSSMSGFPITAIEYSTQFNDKALGLYGSRSRIRFGQPPEKPSLQARALLTALGQPWEDDGEDHIKIATIFLLVPDETPEQERLSEFTGREIWFVQHSLFWNLEHRAPNRDPVNIPSMNASLALLPLVGRYTFAPIMMAATMESMLNAAIASLLNKESNEGKYWTV